MHRSPIRQNTTSGTRSPTGPCRRRVDGQAVNPAAIPVFDAVPLPPHARFVVVGAGVHGLSSAYHLAMYLERTGKGSGSDVVLIDKQGPGAGATGLACGCVSATCT